MFNIHASILLLCRMQRAKAACREIRGRSWPAEFLPTRYTASSTHSSKITLKDCEVRSVIFRYIHALLTHAFSQFMFSPSHRAACKSSVQWNPKMPSSSSMRSWWSANSSWPRRDPRATSCERIAIRCRKKRRSWRANRPLCGCKCCCIFGYPFANQDPYVPLHLSLRLYSGEYGSWSWKLNV